jgi:hypothetical protein
MALFPSALRTGLPTFYNFSPQRQLPYLYLFNAYQIFKASSLFDSCRPMSYQMNRGKEERGLLNG